MKVTFDYDYATGNITDSAGLYICMHGMVPFKDEDTGGAGNVNYIKELVAAGVSVDDILKLKREGAI